MRQNQIDTITSKLQAMTAIGTCLPCGPWDWRTHGRQLQREQQQQQEQEPPEQGQPAQGQQLLAQELQLLVPPQQHPV